MNLIIKLTTALLIAIPSQLFAISLDTAESPLSSIPQGIFGYQEKVGDTIHSFNWQAEENDSGISITVQEDDKTFYNLCTANGDTLMWRILVEGKHNISAVRKGDTLHIEGTRFGNEYNKKVAIDKRPWYQPLSFSLGSFLNSSEEKTSFWVIRADKIEVIALTAEKLGVEDITFDGVSVPAQKVEIRADGFYSKFWHATYWYRKSDNLFLRYQSTHGLPGTDETIVELVETPAQQS